MAGVACFLGMASLALGFFLYTRWRYQKINELALYLRSLSTGNYHMDIRDNREGELSILKNEIYKLVHILSEQASMLEEEKRALSDTLLDISHQLKTPLTSIQMMTDLLENPALPQGKRQEFLFNIASESNRMEWLVLSMLKMAQLDAGVVAMKKDDIPLEKLISKVTQAVQVMLELKKIDLEVQGDDERNLICDGDWTAEALINILKNSIEHTPEHGRIGITCGSNPIGTWIRISDTGKGISKKDLPHLFQRFYKGKESGKNHFGIGLSLSLGIIQRQNGTIEVTSRENEGTTFEVKFYHQGR
jgi:signal transduction histidine kinase